jgi:hypothetical protein
VLQLLHDGLADSRMQERFQPLSRRGVVKNGFPQCPAVQVAFRIQYVVTKVLPDVLQQWCTFTDQCARDLVGINDIGAQLLKEVADRGLAAADTTRQADGKGSVAALHGHLRNCPSENQGVVGTGDFISPEQREKAGTGQIRAEGNRLVLVAPQDGDQAGANHGTHQ